MNKKPLYSPILLSFSIVIASVFLNTDTSAKLKMNKLRFEGDVSKVMFSINSPNAYCATKNRIDISNLETTAQTDSKNIYIKAAKKGSKSTARCFKRLTDNKKQNNTFDKFPHKLNFAVKGTLTLYDKQGKKYVFPDMVLAQGHNTKNNWWLGYSGSYCSYPTKRDQIQCTYKNVPIDHNEGDTWCFTRGRGSVFKRTSANAIKVVHHDCTWN